MSKMYKFGDGTLNCYLSSLQVEQFWTYYSHMIRPSDLSGHCDYHLFKEGIRPMWEVWWSIYVY